MNYDTDKAVQFLKARPGYPVLTSVNVDRETGQRGAVVTQSFPDFHTDKKAETACWSWIETRQGKANIYYSVNTVVSPAVKKAARENIKDIVSLHVDLDPRSGEDQDDALPRLTKLLQAHNPPPTWIIASGGGVQGIWDLPESDWIHIDGNLELAEEAKLYNVQLERNLDGDSCHNIDRIMRLPGTENCPDAKKRAKGRRYAPAYIIEATGKLYPLSGFMKAPKLQEAAAPSGKRGAPVDMTAGAAKVNIPGNVERIFSLFEHPETKDLKPWVIRVLMDGKDEEGEKTWRNKNGDFDRSNAIFACACEMVRHGVSDEVMYSIFTDPDYKISKVILEKKNVEREVSRVISRAHEFAIDPDLAEMNRHNAVVAFGGKALVMYWEESQTERDTLVPGYMSFDHFRNLHMNRRKEIEYVDKRTGEQVNKRVPMGDWWIGNEHRRQFKGVRYMPDSDAEVVNGYLNLWTGFSVPAIKGDKHEKFLAHMRDNLCKGNATYFEYLVKWCATIVQHRDKHTGVATVLRSESEGTGKSLFLKTFGSLFGKHYRHITNPEHLIGKFNAHLQSVSFVFADECFFAGDRKHEGILKTTITEDTMIVEPKGVDATSVPNFINLGMASNNKFVVPASSTSRRYFVLDVGTDHMQDKTYFDAVMNDMKDGGRSHLLYYLLTLDLSGFAVTNVPITEALNEQRALTRKGIDALVEMVAQNGTLPCVHYKYPDVAMTTGAKRGEGLWGYARENFPELRHYSPETMMHIFKHDWHCDRFRAGGITGVRFPTLNKLRTLFDRRHGRQDWDQTASEWQRITAQESAVAGGTSPREGEPAQDDIPF